MKILENLKSFATGTFEFMAKDGLQGGKAGFWAAAAVVTAVIALPAIAAVAAGTGTITLGGIIATGLLAGLAGLGTSLITGPMGAGFGIVRGGVTGMGRDGKARAESQDVELTTAQHNMAQAQARLQAAGVQAVPVAPAVVPAEKAPVHSIAAPSAEPSPGKQSAAIAEALARPQQQSQVERQSYRAENYANAAQGRS